MESIKLLLNNLGPSWQYAKLTLKHKYYVFSAGLKVKAPLYRLIIHDWSKFTLQELPYYGVTFFGNKKSNDLFNYAWNHHQKINKHHWEYWVLVTKHDRGGMYDGAPLEMPEHFVREMVADWLGASKAYEGSYPDNIADWAWFQQNFNRINLHINTKILILKILKEYFNE